MKLNLTENENRRQRLLFWLILAAGVFARCWCFGSVPGGINQDEAFAAYEAWSLLNYGIDTAGYHNPVYLVAWGSGMNALESYLMMPFIALFGLKSWVIRLPQLIVACLSLWVVYLLVKRTVSEKAGLWAMFMLAIAPWHIIASRWGLESNLAPGFLLFGLWFFVMAMEKPAYLMLSALMYGLSLYTYATYWIYTPFIILAMAAYALYFKKLRFDRYTVLAVLILGLLALPLLLFLAINNGLMDEVILPFMSIPKLLYMRTGEFSLDQKRRKLQLFLEFFVLQKDGYLCNSPQKFGLFYYMSMPFALVGGWRVLKKLINSFKEKAFCPEALLLFQFVIALPQFILVKINATKVNIILIPLTVFTALGLYTLASMGKRRLGTLLAALYAAAFIGFEEYYFNEYAEEIKYDFSCGIGEALEVAMEKGEHVYIQERTFYPVVLFYSQTPVEDFRESVEYEFYPAPFLTAKGFDRFSLWANPYQPDETGAYVLLDSGDRGALEEHGFVFENYGVYQVAYRPGEKGQ